MKKLILLFLVWSLPTFSQSNELSICSGSDARSITITDPAQRATFIQNTINNYRNYLIGNAYELCFVYSTNLDVKYRWTKVDLAPLQIPATADKPIIISGLDLKRDSKSADQTSPLFLTDGAEVILHNSKFTCAPNSKPNSVGIKLLGDAHEVIGSEIQNCGTAIQIGDTTTSGNNNRISETKLHDNGTAIKVANGQGNFS